MKQNSYQNDFLREARAQQLPPYHPFNLDNSGRLDNVRGVVALALPRGPVYSNDAQGFRDFREDNHYAPQARIMFQTFLAGIQMTDLGSIWLKLPQGHSRENEVVAALCRKHLGQRKRDDEKKYDKFFKNGYTFDKELTSIICQALKSGIAPTVEEGNGPPAEGDEEPEDGIEIGSEDSVSSNEEVEDLFGEEEEEEGLQPMDEVDEDEEEEEEEEEEGDLIIDELGILSDEEEEEGNGIFEPAIPREPEAIAPERRAEHNYAVAEQAAARLLNGVLKEKIEEKVKMIQVFFTDDRGKDVGSIVFFFQMDPLYNFGEVVDAIANAKMLRDQAAVDNAVGARKRGYSSYQEPFPHLVEDKKHAIHHLSKGFYKNVISSYTGDTRLFADHENILRGNDVWDVTHVNSGDSPNPYHPLSVFTPERALAYMRAAGASEDQCNVDLFRAGRYEDEDGEGRHGQSWCVPPERSYWFASEAAFWKRYGKIGLAGLCFPNITLPKVRRNAMVIAPSDFDRQMQGRYLDTYFNEGSGIISLVQEVEWDPFAKVKLDHIHQLTAENLAFISDLPKNPEARGEAFNEFVEANDAFKLMAASKACQIFRVGNTNISEPLQAIEKWQSEENIRKVSAYTPHAMPQMDTVANMIIRDALMAKHYRHVAEEVRWWLLCHYGLQDCYHYDHEVHLNLIFHGMSQTGKSYFLFDATTKTWIPGTVYDILESSNRADNTDKPVVDACIVQDEIKKEIVDGKAAERDRSGFVEREKAKLTGCRLTYKVLTLRQDHTGRTERIAEWIETDHVATMAAATNKDVKVSGDEALGSRFGKFTICRPTCDVFEFMGIKNKLSSEDKAIKKDQVKHLQIVQMLSAKVQKLIQGAVIGQPSMDVFNVMFARMLAFLKEQGVDVSEQRQIQLMERFAYQLTIRKAIYDLYMRPGSPLFGKVFDLRDMVAHGDWLDKAKSEDALRVYRNAKKHCKSASDQISANEEAIQSAQARIAAAGNDPGGVLSAQIRGLKSENERLQVVANRHYDKMNGAFKELEGSPGIEPYLYCTKQIAIFTFTLMGEMLIDPVTKVVLEALCKFGDFRRSEGEGTEEVFRKDLGGVAPWKLVQIPTDEVDESGARKCVTFYDLNYFEIHGVPKDVAGHVSQYTEPRVSPQDCATYMECLGRKFIRAHKYENVSKATVSSLAPRGGAINRSNFGLKRSAEASIIPILYYDWGQKKTYISIEALERYNVDLLQQAVLYCLYDGWRDNQTFLFGLPIDGYTEVFSSISITKSWGPLVPAVRNNIFVDKDIPVVDKAGRTRDNSEMFLCVDSEGNNIFEKQPMLDDEKNPICVNIPQTEMVNGCSVIVHDAKGNVAMRQEIAYRRTYQVLFPSLGPQNEKLYDEEGGIVLERGFLVKEPIVEREHAGLIDVYSMGPAFLVPEAAYIDDVASDLLCRVPWDAESEVKVYPSNKCDRKIAVVRIEEDLDDWGLEKHLLRQGVGGVVLKEIATQAHIMDFIQAHVKYDAEYRSLYEPAEDNALGKFNVLGNYPRNLIEAIDKRRNQIKEAREFDRIRKHSLSVQEIRSNSDNLAHFNWRNFVDKEYRRIGQKRAVVSGHPLSSASFSSSSSKRKSHDGKKKKKHKKKRNKTSKLNASAGDRGDTLFEDSGQNGSSNDELVFVPLTAESANRFFD